MYNKIRLWWKYEGKYYHKDFIQGVKNIWKWFPTIWKDKDWDHEYIYEILRVKLEKQACYVWNKDRHIQSRRDAEKMFLCARLIQIQKEDLYALEYLDYIEEDHKWNPTDETKKWYTVDSTTIQDDLDEYFEKYSKTHNKILSGEISYFDTPIKEKSRKLIAMEIGHHNQERSRKLLFKMLEKNIEGWWS